MIANAGWPKNCRVGALCGGETLPLDLARNLYAKADTAWNLYGPTETTVWSFHHRLRASDFGTDVHAVPIGRPLPGTTYSLLHEESKEGSGELCIEGPGVSAGYFDRPDLNAGKFVQTGDEGATPGFATGDVVTHLPDGNVVYLGRSDRQIKLNGFRIEPGEIESLINRSAVVEQTAVKLITHSESDKRLAAYVVLTREAVLQHHRTVENWRDVWDAAYRMRSTETDQNGGTGYTSTFTGEALSESDIREWADATSARVTGFSPETVLEIGCGVGIIAQRLLAAGVQQYVGCDISKAALETSHLKLTAGREFTGKWDLQQLPADQIYKLGDRHFDLVLMNSVVQYFPDVTYLGDVLSQAIALCRSGGVVVIGDVPPRSLKLVLGIAAAVGALPAHSSQEDVILKAATIGRGELWLEPFDFAELASHQTRIVAMETDLRLGKGRDEMTRYRYDVVFRLDLDSRRQCTLIETFDYEDIKPNAGGLSRWLADAPSELILRNVPNSDLENDLVIAGPYLPTPQASALQVEQFTGSITKLTPAGFRSWAENRGRSVAIRWSQCTKLGRLDICIGAVGSVYPAFELPVLRTTTPSGSAFRDEPVEVLNVDIGSEIRQLLSENLPGYMIPSHFVYLNRMPLTYNGKIDWTSLPSVDLGSLASDEAEGCPTPGNAEETIARIWGKILGLASPSHAASFFELGGSSILIADLATRLTATFKVDVEVVDLFVHTTIVGQGALIRGLSVGSSTTLDSSRLNEIGSTAERRKSFAASSRLKRDTMR